MVRLRLENGVVDWPEAKFVAELTSKRLPFQTQVSLDGGATWLPALDALKKVGARGDPALAALVPIGVDPTCMVAGYGALGTLLMCGGPATAVAAILGWDTGPTLGVRLGGLGIALVVGPVPPAVLGFVALRALKKNPTARGKGRAIFALVVAGLLTLPVLAGAAFLVIR